MTTVLSCVAGFTTVVHVEVDEQTAEGMEDAAIDPSDLFDGGIPTALCALQGFHTKLNLGQSHSVSRFFHNKLNWAGVRV